MNNRDKDKPKKRDGETVDVVEQWPCPAPMSMDQCRAALDAWAKEAGKVVKGYIFAFQMPTDRVIEFGAIYEDQHAAR